MWCQRLSGVLSAHLINERIHRREHWLKGWANQIEIRFFDLARFFYVKRPFLSHMIRAPKFYETHRGSQVITFKSCRPSQVFSFHRFNDGGWNIMKNKSIMADAQPTGAKRPRPSEEFWVCPLQRVCLQVFEEAKHFTVGKLRRFVKAFSPSFMSNWPQKKTQDWPTERPTDRHALLASGVLQQNKFIHATSP